MAESIVTNFGWYYTKRSTGRFTKIIILGRANTKIMRKTQRGPGNFANGNTGISQGSPLSEQLFVIYADRAVEIYTPHINNDGVNKAQIIARDG